MKELSIEQKAKAYDKVREKIAVRFGSNVAEEIFSEYEESEDERIRKAIIKIIADIAGGFPFEKYGILKKDAIAWLERQGEQKPAESINDAYPETLDKAIDLYYHYYGNGNGYFENLSFEKFKDITKTFVRDYSKQKPAWCEGDEKFFKTALWHISNSISNGTNTDIHCDTTDWFKSLKERYTWKPSDEQMERLKGIINSLPHQEVLYSLYQDLQKLKG